LEQAGLYEEFTIFDTSSIIFLDLLGYVPLLRGLYRVAMPEAVREELSARPDSSGGDVVSIDWVVLGSPSPDRTRQVQQEPPAVGGGETEVIALGMEWSCPVVLDDKKARLRARRAGLEITGTLGILLRLRRLGHVSRELEDDLRSLEQSGMRISPELRRAVIDSESES
jgi:predicted nucleic acid-binding protein